MFSVGFFAFCSQRWRARQFWKGWGSEHVQRRDEDVGKDEADVGKDGADVGKDGADVSVLRANFSLCRSLR